MGALTQSVGSQPSDINAIMAGWVDRGPWQYWDTVVGVVGTAMLPTYSVFSIPIGGVDPITAAQKTKLQTNMQRGNQFPPPRCLVLMQLGIYFASTMLKADIDLVLANYYLELRIDDKIFFEGLLWQFPPGTGLVGSTAKTNESAWHLGMAAPQYTRRYGNYAKYIAPLQQFSVNLTCPGTPPTLSAAAVGGTGLLMVPFMDGLTDRSVQ
jgi:hypothetical protein